MLPLLTAVAPIAGKVLLDTAPVLAGAAVQKGASLLDPASRAMRKEVLKASQALRKGTFGYTDPQRLALLRGGQAQAQALQAQGQAAVAMQQGQGGGPVQGGYAQAQREIARAAQDAAQQYAGQVQMADDAEAQRQKDAALALVAGAAQQRQQGAASTGAPVATAVTQATIQQAKDYKAGEGDFDLDFDSLESVFKPPKKLGNP